MRILANEFVLPFRGGWECHASHLLPLGDGKVFCVFFYGSREGRGDVRIYGSMRSEDCKWSEPVPLSEDDGVPHWNPVLFRRSDGAVILFYKVGETIADWITKCRISYDGCITWSDPFEMVEGDRSGGRGPVRNKAIYLSDGSVIAPASTERGEWKCFFDRSVDHGSSWLRGEDIRIFDTEEGNEKRGIIQPTLWESEEGVHALMRSSEGRIYRTDSVDLGVSWCDPYPISMPNNNSGIDLVCIPDGRIVLICNPNSDNWGKRTPLSLYISNDNGLSFDFYSHLITMEGRYAYPAALYDDGKLHITFTWNRKTIQYICLTDI